MSNERSTSNSPDSMISDYSNTLSGDLNTKSVDFVNLEIDFTALKLQTLKTKRDNFDVNSDEDAEKPTTSHSGKSSNSHTDRYSVEGTPFFKDRIFPEKKKIDLHPTPYKLFNTSENSHIKCKEKIRQQKVLIINSSSNCVGASSASHQENAQRTSLLCSGGNEGLVIYFSTSNLTTSTQTEFVICT